MCFRHESSQGVLVMQDKAGEIGEMIRELIILEIQKLWKEKKEEWMEQFEQ